MNSFLPFIFGLVVGWLIELVIDYFYWRRKAVNTEAEQNLRASLKRVQTENNDLRIQLADFQTQEQHLKEIETRLQAKGNELEALASSYADKEKALEAQVAELKTKNAELTETLQAQVDDLTAKLADCESRQTAGTSPTPETVPFTPPTAEVVPDDLKKIWGIGPKLEQVLRENGIQTFAQLAATSIERLDDILSRAGSRFRMSKQETWAEQAHLAADGKWEELKKLQDEQDWKGDRRL